MVRLKKNFLAIAERVRDKNAGRSGHSWLHRPWSERNKSQFSKREHEEARASGAERKRREDSIARAKRKNPRRAKRGREHNGRARRALRRRVVRAPVRRSTLARAEKPPDRFGRSLLLPFARGERARRRSSIRWVHCPAAMLSLGLFYVEATLKL